MRQSRKEQTTQWLMKEGLMPERREAMALAAQSEEFGGELGAGSAGYHADLAGPLRDAEVDFALLVGSEMAALANARAAHRVAP